MNMKLSLGSIYSIPDQIGFFFNIHMLKGFFFNLFLKKGNVLNVYVYFATRVGTPDVAKILDPLADVSRDGWSYS